MFVLLQLANADPDLCLHSTSRTAHTHQYQLNQLQLVKIAHMDYQILHHQGDEGYGYWATGH